MIKIVFKLIGIISVCSLIACDPYVEFTVVNKCDYTIAYLWSFEENYKLSEADVKMLTHQYNYDIIESDSLNQGNIFGSMSDVKDQINQSSNKKLSFYAYNMEYLKNTPYDSIISTRNYILHEFTYEQLDSMDWKVVLCE